MVYPRRGRPSTKQVQAQKKIASFAKRIYQKKYRNPKFRKYKKLNNAKRVRFNKSNLFSYSNLEKKIIPYIKYMSLAGNPNPKLAPISLLNCGTGSNTSYLISGVVIQTGDNLTQQNLMLNTSNGPIAHEVGGFRPLSSNSVSQSGTNIAGFPTNRMMDGMYCNFINSKLNIRIQMDNDMSQMDATNGDEIDLAHEVARSNLPTTFRVLVVKAKRGHMVAENVKNPQQDSIPDLASNLFIDETAQEVGLNSTGGVQQKFRWRVNKRKWYCLKETYFNLSNVSGIYKAQGVATAGALNQLVNQTPRYPTQKSLTINIPVPKGKTKIDFDPTDVENDHPKGTINNYNYVAHTVILACKPGDEFGAHDWSVETHGQSVFVDL